MKHIVTIGAVVEFSLIIVSQFFAAYVGVCGNNGLSFPSADQGDIEAIECHSSTILSVCPAIPTGGG